MKYKLSNRSIQSIYQLIINGDRGRLERLIKTKNRLLNEGDNDELDGNNNNEHPYVSLVKKQEQELNSVEQRRAYVTQRGNISLSSIQFKKGKNALNVCLGVDDDEKRRKIYNLLSSYEDDFYDMLSQMNVDGENAISQTIRLKRNEQFDHLSEIYLGKQLDLLQTNNFGDTYLHLSIYENDFHSFSHLLQQFRRWRIDVDISNERTGLTPYLLAKKLQRNSMAKELVRYGNAYRWQINRKNMKTGNDLSIDGYRNTLKKSINQLKRKIDFSKMRGDCQQTKLLLYQMKNLKTRLNNPFFTDRSISSDNITNQRIKEDLQLPKLSSSFQIKSHPNNTQLQLQHILNERSIQLSQSFRLPYIHSLGKTSDEILLDAQKSSSSPSRDTKTFGDKRKLNSNRLSKANVKIK
ncbi:hypothetical protein SNEBB_005828 [Seison nebaliae]|nr:hypothetical protein SNEBB_005828 [Seison nebaliae]